MTSCAVVTCTVIPFGHPTQGASLVATPSGLRPRISKFCSGRGLGSPFAPLPLLSYLLLLTGLIYCRLYTIAGVPSILVSAPRPAARVSMTWLLAARYHHRPLDRPAPVDRDAHEFQSRGAVCLFPSFASPVPPGHFLSLGFFPFPYLFLLVSRLPHSTALVHDAHDLCFLSFAVHPVPLPPTAASASVLLSPPLAQRLRVTQAASFVAIRDPPPFHVAQRSGYGFHRLFLQPFSPLDSKTPPASQSKATTAAADNPCPRAVILHLAYITSLFSFPSVPLCRPPLRHRARPSPALAVSESITSVLRHFLALPHTASSFPPPFSPHLPASTAPSPSLRPPLIDALFCFGTANLFPWWTTGSFRGSNLCSIALCFRCFRDSQPTLDSGGFANVQSILSIIDGGLTTARDSRTTLVSLDCVSAILPHLHASPRLRLRRRRPS
ncbi:hypothetical protein C8R45DRAFT_1180010 [Mycena sanguinolenta]|nr:hypothetical protein C8R45DRAFT_1180010 [Mycena sanguinolenta]